MDRRYFIHVSLLGGLAATQNTLSQSKKAVDEKNWKNICREWLVLLMPEDQDGPGADSQPVWDALIELVEDKKFARGFFQGLTALNDVVLPPDEASLTRLMAQKTPISRFLNAFFEIVIEAYYGSELGWKSVGVNNAPQPLGYKMNVVELE